MPHLYRLIYTTSPAPPHLHCLTLTFRHIKISALKIANATKQEKLRCDDLDHNKKAWREIYIRDGIPGLASTVMEEEISLRMRQKKTLLPKDADWTTPIMEQCLLSTEQALLESILDGNLALDSLRNSKLGNILQELRTQSEHQPGIYMQQLVSGDGFSPSATELLTMADLMEGYVKGCRQRETHPLGGVIDDNVAASIDNFKRLGVKRTSVASSKKGYRRYMNSKPRATIDDMLFSKGSAEAPKHYESYSRSHVAEITIFIKQLRQRLHNIPLQERDEPLRCPLVEVRYSVRCVSRLKQHLAHSSSNYIMNLAEAIFQTQRTDFPTSYWIKQFVIYLIWDNSQPEIAEIGFAKLAESFTHNGGGFSHYAAGLSNYSGTLVSGREWNAAKTYMLERSPYLHNLKLERDTLEKEVVEAETQSKEILRQREQARLEAVRSQWLKTVQRDADALLDLANTIVEIESKLAPFMIAGEYTAELSALLREAEADETETG